MNEKQKKKDITRIMISMNPEDVENVAVLKKKLAPNTTSGLFRYLVKFALENTDLILKVNEPVISTKESIDELLSLQKKLGLKRDSDQKRILDELKELRNEISQLKNQTRQKSSTNGLGGK
ncbi:MAG: hypothetical protein ACFFD7_15585 [Candidatus Thorarchaeota archaeon]